MSAATIAANASMFSPVYGARTSTSAANRASTGKTRTSTKLSQIRESQQEIDLTKRKASVPKISAEEAFLQIQQMTEAEHARCTAYMYLGSFTKAAKALKCDPETVSASWKRYGPLMAVMMTACKRRAL